MITALAFIGGFGVGAIVATGVIAWLLWTLFHFNPEGQW